MRASAPHSFIRSSAGVHYPPNELDRLLALCVPHHLNRVLPRRVNDDRGAARLSTVQRSSSGTLDYFDLLDVCRVDVAPTYHDPVDYYQWLLGNLCAAYDDCRCRNRWRRRRDQSV